MNTKPRKHVIRSWWLVIGAVVIGVIVGEIAYWTLHGTLTNDRDNAHESRPTTTAPFKTHVVATIPVGRGPEGIALDPQSRRLYTANNDDNTVSVINTETKTVTATIAVGQMPRRLALDPSTETLYATNTAGKSVSVIDTRTNTVTATIPLDSMPFGAAVDGGTHRLYVAAGNVIVIDTTTRTVTKSLPPDDPFEMAVDPGTATLYVGSAMSPGAVSVIDTVAGSAIRTIPTSDTPWALAVDRGTHTAYFTYGADTGTVLTMIDAHTRGTVEILVGGRGSQGIAVDPGNHNVYVTTGNTVAVVDPSARKVIGTVQVGQNPYGPVLDPGTHTLYTANGRDNTVSVVYLTQ